MCEGPVQEGVFEEVEEVPCSFVVVQDAWGRLPTCSLEKPVKSSEVSGVKSSAVSLNVGSTEDP